jgi:hypothetical protein
MQQIEEPRRYLPRRQRRSIKTDRIHPRHWNHFDLRVSCDDCSFFAPEKGECVIGFKARFRKATQAAEFDRTGEIAMCRFLEID